MRGAAPLESPGYLKLCKRAYSKQLSCQILYQWSFRSRDTGIVCKWGRRCAPPTPRLFLKQCKLACIKKIDFFQNPSHRQSVCNMGVAQPLPLFKLCKLAEAIVLPAMAETVSMDCFRSRAFARHFCCHGAEATEKRMQKSNETVPN